MPPLAVAFFCGEISPGFELGTVGDLCGVCVCDVLCICVVCVFYLDIIVLLLFVTFVL